MAYIVARPRVLELRVNSPGPTSLPLYDAQHPFRVSLPMAAVLAFIAFNRNCTVVGRPRCRSRA